MLNKLVNIFQHSDLAKFFIVGLTIAILQSITGHLSLYIWIAVVLSLLAVLTDLTFFDDHLTYDQKQQVIFNALLFSALSWAVFMWDELQDFPQSYVLVFVILSVSALLLFQSLKLRLTIIIPVLTVFVLLLIFILSPAENAIAVISI
ncbi:MAG: hypothetical protein JKX98_09690, partial [Alcanivoracaceae bacterium]|nr:hypothetical protein [Alcanivoracaceae bacterium]